MEADRDAVAVPAKKMFLELIRPHLRRMYVVARQYVSGATEANGLVQESLLRAWRSFSLNAGVARGAWEWRWGERGSDLGGKRGTTSWDQWSNIRTAKLLN